jgi:hypothetical protein
LVERALELCFFNTGFRIFEGGFYLFFRSFPLFPEFEKDGKVLYCRMNIFIQAYPVFIQLDVLENLRCPCIVVPKAGRKGELFVACYFITSVSDVKETSPTPLRTVSYLLVALVS